LEITIHGKHNHVPDSLREFAIEKMEHLSKYMSTITSVDVEMYEEGKAHKSPLVSVVHVTVATPGPVFRSKVTSSDPRAGIDTALERLERQIKEFKRKRSGKPAHAGPKAPLVEAAPALDSTEG